MQRKDRSRSVVARNPYDLSQSACVYPLRDAAKTLSKQSEKSRRNTLRRIKLRSA